MTFLMLSLSHSPFLPGAEGTKQVSVEPTGREGSCPAPSSWFFTGGEEQNLMGSHSWEKPPGLVTIFLGQQEQVSGFL